MELTETYDESPEKAVLVGADLGTYDAEVSMDELEELARTAGAVVSARVIQKEISPTPRHISVAAGLLRLKNFAKITILTF